MTVNPGHFHAALLQKQVLPGVARTVYVYAPLGPDLVAHLSRISEFNRRPDHPTDWISRIYAGPDYFERMISEHPGNVAIFSGRNRGKIDGIRRVLEAGIHVLADKPWITEPEDLPKLESALETARVKRIAAYDMMTQRLEITNVIQKELINDAAVFGQQTQGNPDHPAVTLDSVHRLLKLVAGRANLRPAWFFDVREQGEGLTDVGTHLVDLVQWILYSNQALDYRKDIRIVASARWPTEVSLPQFRAITGESEFPVWLQSELREGRLEYFCNNRLDYTIKSIHTRVTVRWDFGSPAIGGDTQFSAFQGSRSRIEVREGPDEKYRPEVYVLPNTADLHEPVKQAIQHVLKILASRCPGVTVRNLRNGFQLVIPDPLRLGDEALFARLGEQFLKYVDNPALIPPWEESAMVAKYYTTTQGVALARAIRRPE